MHGTAKMREDHSTLEERTQRACMERMHALAHGQGQGQGQGQAQVRMKTGPLFVCIVMPLKTPEVLPTPDAIQHAAAELKESKPGNYALIPGGNAGTYIAYLVNPEPGQVAYTHVSYDGGLELVTGADAFVHRNTEKDGIRSPEPYTRPLMEKGMSAMQRALDCLCVSGRVAVGVGMLRAGGVKIWNETTSTSIESGTCPDHPIVETFVLNSHTALTPESVHPALNTLWERLLSGR